MGSTRWRTLPRPIMAGLLLGTASVAVAQNVVHTSATIRSNALLAKATAPMSFEEMVHASSPFSGFSNISTSEATSSSSLPDAPSAIEDREDTEASSENDLFPWFRHKQQKQAPVPAVPAPATRADETRHKRPDIGQYTKYIPAGYVTHPQTYHEKVETGVRDLYSVGNIGGWFISSGWSHLVNSRPNYGTDSGAYGQRLGAAVLRSTTQGVMTDIVFAPMFHQDLRYYVKGPRYNVVQRSLYAASRVIVTRRDSSSTTLNTALLAGYLVTAASTQAYYPSDNRGFGNMMNNYGTSLGGAMLINIFNEFQSDILMTLHMKRKTYEPFKDNTPGR